MQDTTDPLANAILQPQSPGTLVLELDWLPLRTNKNEPLVLCIAGADSSVRLIEVNMYVISDYFISWCLTDCLNFILNEMPVVLSISVHVLLRENFLICPVMVEKLLAWPSKSIWWITLMDDLQHP